MMMNNAVMHLQSLHAPSSRSSSPSSLPSSPSTVPSSSSPPAPGVVAPQGEKVKTRARVVWVGNVHPNVHHDELRHIFTAALKGFRSDVRVTHVTMQYQKGKVFNSATVFLNRSVDLNTLQLMLRTHAHQPTLKVKRCKNKRGRKQKQQQKQQPRAWKQHNVAVAPQALYARAAAEAFVMSQCQPLPAEVGVGTCAFDAFMRELDAGREDRTILLA